MKKHIVISLLILSIFISCADIKADIKGDIYRMAKEVGWMVGEGVSCTLGGLKIGEAIQQRNPKRLISLPVLAAGVFLTKRFIDCCIALSFGKIEGERDRKCTQMGAALHLGSRLGMVIGAALIKVNK